MAERPFLDPDFSWMERLNDFKAQYDALSYADHQRFYLDVEKAFPEQTAYTHSLVTDSLRMLKSRNVLELGGWKGDLANIMFQTVPELERWDNYDYCPALASTNRCLDKRYSLVIPETWMWDVEIPNIYDTFVSTHTVEHLKGYQLARLIEKIGSLEHLKSLHVEGYGDIPSDSTSKTWINSLDSHVLELGWKQVLALLDWQGFTKHEYLAQRIVRATRT